MFCELSFQAETEAEEKRMGERTKKIEQRAWNRQGAPKPAPAWERPNLLLLRTISIWLEAKGGNYSC
jgi:hypothetical protein